VDSSHEKAADWKVSEWTPRTPGFSQNPYLFYHRMRTEAPVLLSANNWWVTSYAHVMTVLQDRRFGVEPPPGRAAQPLPPGYERLQEIPPHMLGRNPPDHTRLRGLVSKAFTPRVVEQLRPHIVQIANDLLDRVIPNTELGVPTEDRAQFKDWSNAIIQGMGLDSTPAERQASLDANLALINYFEALIANRRGALGDDLISRMLQAEEQGNQLSTGEVVSSCVLLLIAGHETTTNLIGSGTLALLRHPDQLDLLRQRPDLMETAIEELLRFESPVQRMMRFANVDLELGGQQVKQGQAVIPMMAAANRDPATFIDPDRLDITRNPNPHVGLGRGIHYCLGAPLARLEAAVAFSILLERMPKLRLTRVEPVWYRGSVIRGLKTLPLAF
jgi:pimeloyl-[acyl-carrier protein] synthase